MGIITCSVLNKVTTDKRVKLIPTTLKRETIDRKSSIKLHWCQAKDVRSLSKLVLTPLKDIKEKIAVFKAVLKVDLLWHTSDIFHKAERQRSRLSWNGSWTNLPLKKQIHQKVPLRCYH